MQQNNMNYCLYRYKRIYISHNLIHSTSRACMNRMKKSKELF